MFKNLGYHPTKDLTPVALGVLGSPMSVEAFAAFMRSEETKWTAVTKAVGVKPE